jgi:hypothetical protein
MYAELRFVKSAPQIPHREARDEHPSLESTSMYWQVARVCNETGRFNGIPLLSVVMLLTMVVLPLNLAFVLLLLAN